MDSTNKYKVKNSAGNTSHPVQYRHTQPVHSTQPLTWVLLAVLVLGTPAAVLVLALYLKTLREKRASQVEPFFTTILVQPWGQHLKKIMIRLIIQSMWYLHSHRTFIPVLFPGYVKEIFNSYFKYGCKPDIHIHILDYIFILYHHQDILCIETIFSTIMVK